MTTDPRIEAAAKGDAAAMNSLFISYEGLMQKAARQRHLLPVQEDALAEARLSFLTAVRSYDASLGVPFAGYAKAKLYGDLRTFFKRSRRQWQREVFPAAAGDAEGVSFWDTLAAPAPAASLDDIYAVADAILQLPDRQQQLLHLLYEKEYTQKAAAAELGITQQAAAAMKNRAIKKLKDLLIR